MVDARLNEKRVALSLGLLFALLHIIGVLLIVFGDYIAWSSSMHFMSFSYSVNPFDVVTLIIGAVLAFVAGAVIGWLFAAIWNALRIKE